MMNARNQRICVWSGGLFALLFFVGFGVIARFIPPPAPSKSAQAVATLYRDHANRIRIGMVISMFALCFWVPFIAVMSVQLKRIEGRFSPLTYSQLALGAGLPVAFFPSLYFFCDAAFRPEASAASVQQLNDMGWLPFTGIIFAIFVENLVVGLAVLGDRRDDPVLPRWYGHVSIWAAILYCPAGFDVFTKKGPFAWNGLITWWLSLVAFFIWLIVTMVVELQAVTRHQAAHAAAAGSDSSPYPAADVARKVEAMNAELTELRAQVAGLTRGALAASGPSQTRG